MFSKIQEALAALEVNIDLWERDVSDRWDTWTADQHSAVDWYEEAGLARGELGCMHREHITMNFPNVNINGVWMIYLYEITLGTVLDLAEDALWVLTGRKTSRQLAYELDMCREAGEELLSYVY